MNAKTLTKDWGCGPCVSYDDFTKDKFLRETKAFLKAVGINLAVWGWTNSRDRGDFVSVNRGGVAVSGEVTLTMKKDGRFLYVQIGSSCIGQVSGKRHPNNVYILYRHSDGEKDVYACQGQNR